jgi:hypothetical protein
LPDLFTKIYAHSNLETLHAYSTVVQCIVIITYPLSLLRLLVIN